MQRKRFEARTPEEVLERREAVRWCAACRMPHGPFIYFENGKHYCHRCAERVYGVMGLRSAGRRADDLQYPERESAAVMAGDIDQ